jgi:putative copper export protein
MLAPVLLWAAKAALSVSVLLGLGAVTLRLDVMSRAALDPSEAAVVLRRALTMAAWGAALAMLAVGVRALAQAAGLAFPGESLTPLFLDVFRCGDLRSLLLIQSGAAVVAFASFAVARTGAILAWISAAGAMLLLAVVLGLDGHASAAEAPLIPIAAATLHVVGAGAWLGTLWHLWRAIHTPSAGRLVAAFHRVALLGAGIVVVSGAIQAWGLIASPADLIASPWGRLLLAKLALVVVVLFLGHRHWRGATADLAAGDRRQIARSFSVEVVVALAVVLLSALLATTSPPA